MIAGCCCTSSWAIFFRQYDKGKVRWWWEVCEIRSRSLGIRWCFLDDNFSETRWIYRQRDITAESFGGWNFFQRRMRQTAGIRATGTGQGNNKTRNRKNLTRLQYWLKRFRISLKKVLNGFRNKFSRLRCFLFPLVSEQSIHKFHTSAVVN